MTLLVDTHTFIRSLWHCSPLVNNFGSRKEREIDTHSSRPDPLDISEESGNIQLSAPHRTRSMRRNAAGRPHVGWSLELRGTRRSRLSVWHAIGTADFEDSCSPWSPFPRAIAFIEHHSSKR